MILDKASLRRIPLNLPNLLTLLRLVMCSGYLLVLSLPVPHAWSWALSLFLVASVTDWLDGFLARRYGQITHFGQLFDPLADKILMMSAFVSLVAFHHVPMWIVVVILAREFLITGLRTMAAAHHYILAAERLGKHKTVFQIIAVINSLLGLSLGEFGFGDTVFARFTASAELPFYGIALVITVGSGLTYLLKNLPVLAEPE